GRMANGAGVYGSISKVVRKASFDHLVKVLNDPALKMNLVIVSDQKARSVKATWRDHETVGVMGELFSLWNYHSGLIGWTENPRHVRHDRELIDEMKSHAVCKDAEETFRYVKGLAGLV